MWHMKTVVIPVVVGAFGTLKKGMVENIKKVSERATMTEIQKICMLGSARILRKVLSVWTEWLTWVTDALGAWFAPGWCTERTPAKTVISNGNRTEWNPIRSVIIRVINKIGRPRSGSPICLITSMITDWIGRHEVLLPINHNFNKICDTIGYFLNQNTRNSKSCFASSEKKSHLSARLMARTVQLLRHDAYCPIKLSNQGWNQGSW